MNEPIPIGVTIREKYAPAMEIMEQAEATAYWNRLVEHNLFSCAAEGIARTGEEAESHERANLGYYAGYYGTDVQGRVERLFLAVHPVFGSVAREPQMTTEEVLQSGMKMAQEARDRE